MRILAPLPLYPPKSLVGAWITTHEFLRHLVSQGHQADVVTTLGKHLPHELDGVTIHPKDTRFDHDAHDLVLGHAGDRGTAMRAAAGRPLVMMVHGNIDNVRLRLSGAALVVFNSHHLAESTSWDGPSIVAHPPVDPSGFTRSTGDKVTIVNLSPAKGGDVFWRLAARLPDVEFLAVRGGYGQQMTRKLRNVEVIDQTNDMAAVYAASRIVLMPSARESWGRVGLEAAAAGVPVIAHPTRGIVEAMGTAATYADRRDLPAWVDAINGLQNPKAWAKASKLALARSTHHDPNVALATFAAAVGSLAPVPA